MIKCLLTIKLTIIFAKTLVLLTVIKTIITIIFAIKISENNRDLTIIAKRLHRNAGPYF